VAPTFVSLKNDKGRARNGATSRGKWSEPARLRIEILPAWYQTFLFRSICGVAFLVSLWSVYLLRLKQLEQQFNTALEARVDERTRIAREHRQATFSQSPFSESSTRRRLILLP
jgi:hypothetical protein